MSKKVLITGLTGQDGSYMAEYLLNKGGFYVFGMVRRTSTPNYTNIKGILNNPNLKIVTGDLTDSHSINNLVQTIKPDYFINFGAQSFVGSSWDLPEQTFDVVALGVLRCLEAIRNYAPECRFYNAGSSEQFGDVLYSPQDEGHPFRPRSPYAAAKCASHHLVKVYRESYGLYAVQGLLLNHESERRGVEFVTRKITKGVAKIFRAIEKGEFFNSIELGNLDAKRDWSHAEDFVDGVWKMLNQEVSWNTLHNPPYPLTRDYVLSSNEAHSVREFVEKAFYYAGIKGRWIGKGVDEKFVVQGESEGLSLVEVNSKFYRPAEVGTLLGDSTLARKELGWEPKVSFDQLVSRMVLNDLGS